MHSTIRVASKHHAAPGGSWIDRRLTRFFVEATRGLNVMAEAAEAPAHPLPPPIGVADKGSDRYGSRTLVKSISD